MTVPVGGASTINGIVYQMLWSLARTGKLQIVGIEKATEEEFSGATLVLEPASGGDLKICDGTPSVEQVKSRSDGGTFSKSHCLTQ